MAPVVLREAQPAAWGRKPVDSRPMSHVGAENLRLGRRDPGHAPALRPGVCATGRGAGGVGPMPMRHVLGDITNATQAAPRLMKLAAPAAAAQPFNAAFHGDEVDVQSVAEYAADVHRNNFAEEAAFLPAPNYMEAQTEINAKMRAILIDWLIEVHANYRFRSETLFLVVNIIDRFLSIRLVKRRKLQLVGVVAMFIASKFEEINPPSVAEFAHISDNTCTKAEILSLECVVLGALDFQIATPTQAHFFERLARANGCDSQHRFLAQYCMELGLLDIDTTRYAPSLLVSAALLVSNQLLGRRPSWPASMVYHARHRDADPEMLVCARGLSTALEHAHESSLQAVRRKYQQERCGAVANMSFKART